MDFIPQVQVVKEDEPEYAEMAEPCDATNGGGTVNDGKQSNVEVEEEVIEEVIEKVKEDTPPEPVENIFEEPQKLTKAGKPRKKRRPLTEEEKARLAKAREKATEARRRKAAEKREALELEKKEKELLKKQKKKKLEDLEKSLETKEEKVEKVVEKVETAPQPVKDKPTPTQGLFTKKDLDEAVMNGIMGYEKIRKERKSKKKAEESKAKEQQQLKQTLQQAIAPKPFNPYASCY